VTIEENAVFQLESIDFFSICNYDIYIMDREISGRRNILDSKSNVDACDSGYACLYTKKKVKGVEVKISNTLIFK